MCYNASYLLDRIVKFARYHQLHIDPDTLKNIYFTNAFEHLSIPVIPGEEPDKIRPYRWGLMSNRFRNPQKAVEWSNKLLNARGEDMFAPSKRMYYEPALKRRCAVVATGFFEYHHHNGKTYPFYIELKDQKPLLLAGVYERYVNKETGEFADTVSIVTTKANELLELIHNNPKLKEARMPAVLAEERYPDWIKPGGDVDFLKTLLRPYNEKAFTAIPAPKLTGKDGAGNRPEALQKKPYPELEEVEEKIREITEG